MDVVSLCPFRVTSVLWQQRPGSWIKTVICKGTFEIVPGEARLAPDQEEPNEQDNHWDDDPARSLYSPSDIVPFKTRCDVLLVGHAFAPGGEPARSVVARMRIGEINKAIEVFGERLWTFDKGVREGARFSKMPLRYERASGGPMSWNPVGIRTDLRPNASTLVPIPNLQPAGTRLTEPGVFVEPIGFGPIAPSWPPRRHRLGPYAGTFTDQSLRREPLPPDMDPGFWNSAPRDQQPGNIRSNERISLENLHPDHARLTTALPGLYPRAFVDKGAGTAAQELPLTCDTLWIDTDRALCTLTWRACLPVEGPAQVGRILIGMEGPGKRLAWADIERLAALTPANASQAHAPQAAIEIADPETIDGEPIEDDEEDEGRATQLPPSARRRPAAGAPAAPPEGGDEALATLAFPVNFQKLAALQGEKRGPMDTVLADFEQEEGWSSETVAPPGAAPPLANPAMPFVRAPRGAPGAPAPSGPAVAKGPGAPPAPGPPPPPPAPEGPRIRFGPPPPPPPSSPGDAAPAWLSQPRVSPPVAPPPPPPGAGNPHTSAIPLASVGAPSGAGTPVPPSPVSAPPITPMPGHSPTLPSRSIEFGPPPSPAIPSLLSVPVPSAVVAQPLLTPTPQPSSPPIAPISSPPAAPAGEGIAHPGVGTAALAGALAASNAAAAAARVEPAPAASPAAPLPRHFGSNAPREACHLLWYEKESVSAVRAAPDWKALIESLDKDREPAFFDFDEEPPPEPPPEVQERRAIVAVLTRAPAMDTDTLGLLLVESVGDDGSFTPPLVVMAGELFFPFDEVETLKATVTAVTPLIAPDRDKKLKETVDTANELLKTPWIHSSSGIAEGMTQKVREAFAQGSRMMPAGYLDTHTQRILLEQRHYQKRSVFGEEAIRSELVPFGSQVPIPTYLPSGLAKKLPMFQRLKVRLIAEAHVQQDQFESHPSALRVVALGRAVTLGGRGR